MRELYLNTPAGLCGNEDCGQMSAWYVFSAMGFYPVDPVGGNMKSVPPISGNEDAPARWKDLYGTGAGGEQGNCYIQSVKLNGKNYDKSYITHEQIMDGSVSN